MPIFLLPLHSLPTVLLKLFNSEAMLQVLLQRWHVATIATEMTGSVEFCVLSATTDSKSESGEEKLMTS